ncbi:hypothetical protein ACE38W_13055 [Chitinophaga sp. Hz27]|uniref:hypothetical protein n=1 Tax=Chitinophaga sp. Hz27 TaxID=3347169 RepID=UPI0035DA365E
MNVEKANTFTPSIKDILSIIVVLPTIFGGIWQLLELICINPAYIRFFSVTQLVPDGLLILSIILSGGLMYLIVIVLPQRLARLPFKQDEKLKESYSYDDDNQIANAEFKLDKKEMLTAVTFFSAAIVVYSHSLWVRVLQLVITRKKISMPEILELTITLPFILLLLKLIYKNVKAYLPDAIKLILQLIAFLSLGGFLLVIGFSVIVFHNSFSLPGNFKNLGNIMNKEQVTSIPNSTSEIIYFNDKYIFIKIKYTTGIDSIEVKKFDEFLEDDKRNKDI